MYQTTTLGFYLEDGVRFSAHKGNNDETAVISAGVGFTTPLVMFLNTEQVRALAFELNTYLDSITRKANEDCETCGGSGTLAVWDGVSAYSGDDACPNCFPELVG